MSREAGVERSGSPAVKDRRGPKAAPKRRAPRQPKTGAPWRHEFSAGFILFRDTPDGRVYLLLDYGRHWDYAKGHLEPGESAWKAAVRELREETGIRQVDRVGTFRHAMEYRFFSPKKGRVFKTVTYFLGRTSVEKVKVSDEHAGYAWLAFAQAMGQLTFENARAILAAAEAYLKGGGHAAQEGRR